MKKIVIVVLTVIFGVLVRAQAPHNPPLDTIVGNEITYYYNVNNYCTNFYYIHRGSQYVTAQQYYADSILRIVGLAVCAKEGESVDDFWYNDYTFYIDSIVRLYVYEAGTGQLIQLCSKTVNLRSVSRWMTVHGRYGDPVPFWDDVMNDWTFPVIEVYFDTVVTVDDSFYIGFGPVQPSKQHVFVMKMLENTAQSYGSSSPGLCPLPLMAEYDMENSSWIYFSSRTTTHKPWCIYPILDSTGWSEYCDTMVCPLVAELNVSVGYGMAVCSWLGDTLNGHVQWQLSYGLVGTEPEDGRVITITELSRVLNDLEDTVEYVVYVRGYCGVCRKWGEWSEGTVFRLRGQEGVLTAEAECGVRLAPNPSHGRVEVSSDCGMQRVTVYDAQGAQVQTQQVSGNAAVVDLSGRPAGLYFVVVYAPAGTVYRKLVIE